ncbi:WecB/TagA/CpsF family glycosyltransferase [Shewanella sp. 10B]|uniref:WecB/TagA/CpsF family glycosyltransferase n=1 Tax=Shewanella sp. 10B TaxID=2943322 RepID=UPI00201A99A0
MFSDGLLLTWLNNLFEDKKIVRTSFDYSSIASDFFDFCSYKKLKVGLLGGAEDEISVACERIKVLHPSLIVSLHRNGYFSSDNEKNDFINSLIANDVDVVIVGLGSPLQEDFAIMLYNKMPNLKCVITCGGFITQTSIKADYYPRLIKKFGLRWLYRAILHKHVRKRLFIDYPKFFISYILLVLQRK